MFIGFNEAFDSLLLDKIWLASSQQGVPIKIIELLKNLYENSRARIQPDEESDWFSIERCVRQGDPLSPNIFNSILEFIFRQVNWKVKGIIIKIRDQKLAHFKHLTNLRFADDIAIVAKSGEELKVMAADLRIESEKVGLTINYDKTKILTNIADLDEIRINNNKIEIVDEYKYFDVWRGVWRCTHAKLAPLTPHPFTRDRHYGPAS